MNYDKLSRSLRYYYEKGIMQKVSDPPATPWQGVTIPCCLRVQQERDKVRCEVCGASPRQG